MLSHGYPAGSALLRSAAPEAGVAGVAVVADEPRGMVLCTDRRARDLHLFQSGIRSGPTIEAQLGRTARGNTSEIRTHWPDFTLLARSLHVYSFLCAPLLSDGEVVATLELYGDRSYAFDRIDEQRLARLTGIVGTALRCGSGVLRGRKAFR